MKILVDMDRLLGGHWKITADNNRHGCAEVCVDGDKLHLRTAGGPVNRFPGSLAPMEREMKSKPQHSCFSGFIPKLARGETEITITSETWFPIQPCPKCLAKRLAKAQDRVNAYANERKAARLDLWADDC